MRMEASGTNTEPHRATSSSGRRYGVQLSASNLLRWPLSTLLEYSGFLSRLQSTNSDESDNVTYRDDSGALSTTTGEVAIRMIGATDQEHNTVGGQNEAVVQPTGSAVSVGEGEVASQADVGPTESNNSNRDYSYQRCDIQQAARWIEQVLPFALLLLVVFVRQHLQGREENISSGVHISFLHCSCNWDLLVVPKDDLLYPLLMLLPKTIPLFWHVIFIIMVNDTSVRQAAMVFKCFLLMYYKNSRGHNYRKQGQMLTLIEYLLLLYRALLPAPVWYRFFLNKEYGGLFSSLMTGLYLTFKLTSVIEKVQSFFTALKTLSRKEIHYGAYATSEQVNAAWDLCAICQEKMHAPILLRCKHIFCEDCVSEWFERERTCPLCRALVKSADLKSFADGSTSLFYQLF